MRGIGFKGQIPELVDDQELWLGKLRESLLEPPFAVTYEDYARGFLRQSFPAINKRAAPVIAA